MAITAPTLWLDGDMIASKDANVPLMGHAAQRGSLVFDVGSFSTAAGARGPALFRARDHVSRFKRSLKLVGLDIAFDDEALLQAAIRVVAASGTGGNDAAQGLVRWSAFYSAREPDLIPRDPSTRVAVAAQSFQDPPTQEPIKVAIFDDARKAPPEALPVEAKAAAAYLGPMIARKRAIAGGADDVVLLDREGNLAEAPIANVFAVIASSLWTPPLGRILPGITRNTVLAIARAEGISVREEPISVAQFCGADEAFLTATSFPIAPIGSINGKALSSASPGPITQRLIDRVLAARRGQEPKHEGWLTYVR